MQRANLQNQETLVIQIDALALEELGDLSVGAATPINRVAGFVASANLLFHRPGDDELGALDTSCRQSGGICDYRDKVDVHSGRSQVGIGGGGVNEMGQFRLSAAREMRRKKCGSSSPELFCLESKDKQQRVNHVGLSRSIWPDDRGKGRVERANLDAPTIRFEVFTDELVQNQTRLQLGRGRRWLVRCRQHQYTIRDFLARLEQLERSCLYKRYVARQAGRRCLSEIRSRVEMQPGKITKCFEEMSRLGRPCVKS